MRIKIYSERTIGNREIYLRYFIDWCAERGITQPVEVTKAIIERYQRWIYHYRNEKTGRAMSTRRQFVRIVPVRSFFKWTARQNHTLYNPASELDLPKMEKRLPKHILSAPEADTVLNGVNITTAFGLRDRAILEVFYSTGMRRMELLNLKLHDLDIDRGPSWCARARERKTA